MPVQSAVRLPDFASNTARCSHSPSPDEYQPSAVGAHEDGTVRPSTPWGISTRQSTWPASSSMSKAASPTHAPTRMPRAGRCDEQMMPMFGADG